MEPRTYDDFLDTGNLPLHGIKNYLAKLIGHQEANVSKNHRASLTSTVNFTKHSTGTGLVISEIVGYTAAISGGILLSTEVVIVKRNPYINQHIVEVLFWGWTINTAVSLILMFTIETPVLPSNWFDVTMVIVHSGTCAAIWPLMSYQTKTVAGNTATLILSAQVVFMLVSQYTVLSSILPGHRNWMEVVGVVLVFTWILIVFCSGNCDSQYIINNSLLPVLHLICATGFQFVGFELWSFDHTVEITSISSYWPHV